MAALLNFTSNFAVDTGEFSPGAKVSFFLSGTTTAVTVYQDEALTTPHATPVEANASGRFPDVWAAGAFALKAVVTDADGATIDTFDPVTINGTTSVASQISGAISATVQAYDAGLTSIAGLTTVADRMIYTTAADTYTVAPLTSFARTLLDDADAATAQGTLGLGTFAVEDTADYVLAQSTWNNRTDTTESLISPAKLTGRITHDTLETQVVAGSPSVLNFTFDEAEYSSVYLIIAGIAPATDGAQLYLRTSANDGSSFDSGASDYRHLSMFSRVGGGVANGGSNSDSKIVVTSGSGVGSAAGETLSGRVEVYGANLTGHTQIAFNAEYDRDNNMSHATDPPQQLLAGSLLDPLVTLLVLRSMRIG